MKKVAVVLSGCGFQDGAEIHESVLTLLALSQQGASYECFAPNINQTKVVNHLTSEPDVEDVRNVLVESARIARGAIKSIDELQIANFDALILPGGFGAALNLSSFATDGADFIINEGLQFAITSTYEARKPIGALCIAPVIVAKLIDAKVTIGSNGDVAGAINSFGAIHQDTTHGEVVIDADKKIVTTPCYMLDASVAQIFDGVNKLVKEVLALA